MKFPIPSLHNRGLLSLVSTTELGVLLVHAAPGFLFRARSIINIGDIGDIGIINIGDIGDGRNTQEVPKWSSIKPVPRILN